MTIRRFEGKHHTMLGVAPADITFDVAQRTYTLGGQPDPQPYESFDYDADTAILRVWTSPTVHFRIAECREVAAG